MPGTFFEDVEKALGCFSGESVLSGRATVVRLRVCPVLSIRRNYHGLVRI